MTLISRFAAEKIKDYLEARKKGEKGGRGKEAASRQKEKEKERRKELKTMRFG